MLAIGITSNHIVTGLSVAFDTFIEGLQERAIEYILVDAGVGTSIDRAGIFSIKRMFGVFVVLFRFLLNLKNTDIVYVTMGASRLGFLRDLFIIFITKLFNRKLVFHLHGGGYYDFYQGNPLWFKFVIRTALNRVDRIIVLGELLRNQFSFLSSKYGPEIVVVPNGLPIDAISIGEHKAILLGEPLKLLYLSNMILSKGYLQVLEACKILKNKKINFTCDFAGEFMSTGSTSDSMGPNFARDHFFDLIKEYKLTNNVCFHGVVRGNEKQKLFLDAHIFLLPTQYSGEGQPISIIEALSYGMPVVATRFRGIPEQVEDGLDGILIDTPNPVNIAGAIEQITHNHDRFEAMSQHAHKTFKERFTREQYLERLIPAVLCF